MDRTSRIGTFLCVALLLMLLVFFPPPQKPKPPAAVPASASPATPENASAVQALVAIPTPAPAVPVVPIVETETVLENPSVNVTLSSADAAIKLVELKEHKEGSGNILLNEQSHANVMALDGWPGAAAAGFQIERTFPQGVVYATDLPNGLKWERSYALGKDYTLDVKDNLTNPGASDVTAPAFGLKLGRAQPLLVGGHYQPISNLYLGSGWFTQKFHLTTINDFNSSSYFWIVPARPWRAAFSSNDKDQDPLPLRWVGVENQFFAVLLTPLADHPIDHAEFRCFNTPDDSGIVPRTDEPDIETTAFFPPVAVPAGKTVTLDYSLYAGPKEYDRLNALGDLQGELMNYGYCEPVILLMLSGIKFWHGLGCSYGVSIILLTLMVKIITWPLVSISNRSGKRMQALGPKLKELQLKYKDQPEKASSETWGLYRDYGVNPLKGCLPALIQMPVFISLYYMLQNLSELRGQSFFWIHDLTQPDTVLSYNLSFALPLFGSHLALNPLPIMVTALTMFMMRMTPQIGDPAQAKIAQWMPLVFLFIFYNFAAGLSLYYVVNNCVSILQIYRNLRKPLPELKRIPRKKGPEK
jgi:YidC/Oxa1 family membrane protein insertase